MTDDKAAEAIRPEYPNPEHRKADRAARRRAYAALDGIEEEVATLRKRLKAADNPLSSIDGDDTQTIQGLVRNLTAELAIMAALRDVREWVKADRETAVLDAQRAWQRWLALNGESADGKPYEPGGETRDAFMDAFTAARVSAPWMDDTRKERD